MRGSVTDQPTGYCPLWTPDLIHLLSAKRSHNSLKICDWLAQARRGALAIGASTVTRSMKICCATGSANLRPEHRTKTGQIDDWVSGLCHRRCARLFDVAGRRSVWRASGSRRNEPATAALNWDGIASARDRRKMDDPHFLCRSRMPFIEPPKAAGPRRGVAEQTELVHAV
jgi:hypothetical protein